MLRALRRATVGVIVCALAGRAQSATPTAAEHVALGDSAHAAFDPATALEHYQAAIQLDSANADALGKASRSVMDLSEAEGDKNKRSQLFRQGESYARRAVALNPRDPELQFHLARALGRAALAVGVRERVKYAVEIRSTALKALELDSLHPGALHVIAMWNAEVMRLSGFERFMAKNLLGGRVFGQANWNEAVRNLERAVEVDPERLSHRLDLGMIYADVGQKAKAREMLQWVVNAEKRTDFNDPRYKRDAEAALTKLK
jgi:tetratricopeptide (TPR) repeat protein